MSKSYLRYFESGVLTSEYDYAKEILNLNATASYWMGNRARILDQFVVFADQKQKKQLLWYEKAAERTQRYGDHFTKTLYHGNYHQTGNRKHVAHSFQ